MKTHFKSIFTVAIFLSIFSIILVGCAKTNDTNTPQYVSSEERIGALTEDFLTESFNKQFSNWNFDSFHIDITNIQESDQLFCVNASLSASNSTFDYKEDYICRYEPQGNNWLLVDCQTSHSSLDIHSSSITQEMADSKLIQILPLNSTFSLLSHTLDKDNKQDLYTYAVLTEEGYKLSEYVYHIFYTFDLNDGWQYEKHLASMQNSTWNIEGDWSYHNSTSDAKITIHQIEGNTLKVEYDYVLFYETPFYFSKESGKSTRVEQVDLCSGGDSLYFKLGDETFYLDQYVGISVANEALIFSYDSGSGYDVPIQHYLPYSYNLIDSYAASYTNTSLKVSASPDYIGRPRAYTSFAHSGGNSSRATQTYELYGAYRSLYGVFYLGKGASIGSHAVAKIYGDGKLLYQFDAATFTENIFEHKFVVDITGIRELTIDMPGNYASNPTSWPGVNFHEPVINLTDVIVTAADAYDAVSIEIPNWSYTDTTVLSQSCFSFSTETGIRPIFVALPYNEKYFTLNGNYDYILDTETVLTYAKSIYDKHAQNNEDHFIILYFSDGVSSSGSSNYFYIYGLNELTGDGNSTSFFYSLIEQSKDSQKTCITRVAEALNEYKLWLNAN